MTRSAGPPGRAATTSSTARRSTRIAGTRSSARIPRSYTVAGGALTITTEPGDIYTGDTNPPPNNFMLQSADHAGEDWVIETKIDRHDQRRLRPGRPDRLRRTATTTSSSTRSRTPGNRGSTASSCARRSTARPRPAGRTRPQPAGQRPDLAAADQGRQHLLRRVLVRRQHLDRPGGPVANAMADAGLRRLRVRPAGRGRSATRSTFDYFLVDGRDASDPCECGRPEATASTGALEQDKWNAIAASGGQVRRSTAAGSPRPSTATSTRAATRRRRRLHPAGADHAGADWVIETHIDAHIGGGYEQGGLHGLRRRQQLRQVRHHLRRRAEAESTGSSCAPRSAGR